MPRKKQSPGAALAALRKPVPHICQHCGEEFNAIKRSGPLAPKFCSNRCKQADKYARKKAEKSTKSS